MEKLEKLEKGESGTRKIEFSPHATFGVTRPPPLTRRAGRLATHARCAALSL